MLEAFVLQKMKETAEVQPEKALGTVLGGHGIGGPP